MPTDNGLDIGLANNSYIGKNKYGQLSMFNDANLQYAQPGSVQAATIDGTTYTGTTTTPETGWSDKIAGWFKPKGTTGTSTGGNIMNAVGTGVGALSGLAGMYYANKNYDLQKDQQDYLKGREAQSDSRKSAFASNAGNGAQY